MEEDHAVQFVAFKYGPASAGAGVHLVHAFPTPFDKPLTTSLIASLGSKRLMDAALFLNGWLPYAPTLH
jgi:hypothetical protein